MKVAEVVKSDGPRSSARNSGTEVIDQSVMLKRKENTEGYRSLTTGVPRNEEIQK
jgi:hypothetical protein